MPTEGDDRAPTSRVCRCTRMRRRWRQLAAAEQVRNPQAMQQNSRAGPPNNVVVGMAWAPSKPANAPDERTMSACAHASRSSGSAAAAAGLNRRARGSVTGMPVCQTLCTISRACPGQFQCACLRIATQQPRKRCIGHARATASRHVCRHDASLPRCPCLSNEANHPSERLEFVFRDHRSVFRLGGMPPRWAVEPMRPGRGRRLHRRRCLSGSG